MSTTSNPGNASVYSLGAGAVSTGSFAFSPIVSPSAPGTKVVGPNGPIKLGTLWLDSLTQTCYQLTKLTPSPAGLSGTWTVLGGTTSDVNTLTGNTGGAVSPTGSNINIVGTGDVSVSGSGSTLTIAVTGGTGTVSTLTGNSGGALSPTGGNISVVGTGDISVAGAGSTLTISSSSSGAVTSVDASVGGSAAPAAGVLKLYGVANQIITERAAADQITVYLDSDVSIVATLTAGIGS